MNEGNIIDSLVYYLSSALSNMDGIQALQAIKGSDAGAKIVMCSAMGQEAMVVEAIKLGAMDFIVKPFKPDRILQTVQKVLG